MGLFFWKDNAKIDSFAVAVADDLFSFVQPDVARDIFEGTAQGNKKKKLKIERRLAGVIDQMHQFGEANSLGVYGKARLQKQFSDRLLELGYDLDVTSKLVEKILFRVS